MSWRILRIDYTSKQVDIPFLNMELGMLSKSLQPSLRTEAAQRGWSCEQVVYMPASQVLRLDNYAAAQLARVACRVRDKRKANRLCLKQRERKVFNVRAQEE
jgi:hypothetical protein